MGYIPSIPHQTETSNPYQSITPKAMETFFSWGHSVEGPIWFLLHILLWKNCQGRFERTFLSMWEGTEQEALEEQRPCNNRTEKKYVMTRQSRVKIKTKGILTIINQVLGPPRILWLYIEDLELLAIVSIQKPIIPWQTLNNSTISGREDVKKAPRRCPRMAGSMQKRNNSRKMLHLMMSVFFAMVRRNLVITFFSIAPRQVCCGSWYSPCLEWFRWCIPRSKKCS